MARFTHAELQAARGRTVPDLVGDQVRLVFVGINPGLWTAAAQAHFARRGNRFYQALYLAGIIDAPLDVSAGFTPESEAMLTSRGIAITNLVDRATARADELDAAELRAGAAALGSKVAAWAPRVVAFVGISAYRVAVGRRDAVVGRQDHDLSTAQVWALPNPSGLNAHYQVAELARLYRQPAAAAGIALAPLRLP